MIAVYGSPESLEGERARVRPFSFCILPNPRPARRTSGSPKRLETILSSYSPSPNLPSDHETSIDSTHVTRTKLLGHLATVGSCRESDRGVCGPAERWRSGFRV